MPLLRTLPIVALLTLVSACQGGKTGGGGGGPGGNPNDLDDDGYGTSVDCDDSSSAIYPGADERCNGIDDNCDGQIDEASAVDGLISYPDADGDGWGSDEGVLVCPETAGYGITSGDCDDADASINPDTEEACDGVDNDCDGLVDEPGATGGSTYHIDRDGDGYGHPVLTGTACAPGDGYVEDATDCDDGDPARNPGEMEKCSNGLDDDCDGAVDEVDANTIAPTWYYDGDGDGYGTTAPTLETCERPDGYASNDTDCDDTNATVHPDAADWPDGLDNNCNGEIDEIGTSFGGTFNYQYGSGSDPSARDCDEYWVTAGTETGACPDCDWTFSVDFTYDASASSASGGSCLSDSFGEDFTWDLGFVADYYGSSALALYYDGEWYPYFTADWDATTGELIWSGGYYEESWGYDYGYGYGYYVVPVPGGTYYETNWFYGHAFVVP